MSAMRFSCSVEVAAIRAEPRADAEQVTQALAGEPLDVEEQRDGWARVRTAYGYPGWVREEDLARTPPDPNWLLAPRAGSVVDEARAYLGAPYVWGGMTTAGIDCSGLVHMAYRRLGRLVPRDADQQEAAGERLKEVDLRAGDLVTYGEHDACTHVAFWLGEGRILHSTKRDGVDGVLEEPEPDELEARRRAFVRL